MTGAASKGGKPCPYRYGLRMNRHQIAIIAGPTATGKTDVAVKVALAVNGEVIGADSMQVYRGMGIGSAAPTEEQMRGVPHHLTGVVNPDEEMTVADWVDRAETLIGEIASRGRAPIVVLTRGTRFNSAIKPS